MYMKAVATYVPFFVEPDDDDGIRGPFSDIWKIIRIKLNISLDIEFFGTLEMGQVLSATNGTGIMGSLIRNETQFSIIPQYLEELGIKYLDYTTVLGQDDWSFLSGPPKIFFPDPLSTLKTFDEAVKDIQLIHQHLRYTSLVLLKASLGWCTRCSLSRKLWNATICVLISYSMIWGLLVTIKKNGRFSRMNFLPEFQNCLFTTFKSLVNQDIRPKTFEKLYERLCVTFWLLGSSCLVLAFTGTMFSKLAKEDDPFRYETLEDFIIHPKKLVIVQHTPPYDQIKNSDDPTSIQIWNKALKDETSKPFADYNEIEIFDGLGNGTLAGIMIKRAMLGMSAFVCGLFKNVYISKKPFVDTMFMTYMRRDIDLKYKNIIKRTAFQLAESRLIESKLDTLAFIGDLCMARTQKEPTSPLPINKFYFIFILHVFVLSLASCCVILEVALFWKDL